MSEKTISSKLLPFLGLLLLWFMALICIHPFGEFPVNDDWCYAKDVYSLSVNKKFTIDLWPSMTLISQTLWGTLFASAFGFSFTALKCSTLVLAVAGSFSLYLLLTKLIKNNIVSFLFTCSFYFNPLFLPLSFTYMTDVFFVTFVLLSFHAAYNYLHSGKRAPYVLFITFCTISTLDRQYGLLTAFIFIPALLLLKPLSVKSVFYAGLPMAVSLFFHFSYRLFLKINHIPSNRYGVSMIADFIRNFKLALSLSKTVDIFLLAGILLIPCALIFVLNKVHVNRRLLIILGLCLCLFSILTYNSGSSFPVGNTLNLSGIGPKLTKDLSWNENVKFTINPASLLLLKILGVLSISFIVSGILNSFSFKNVTRSPGQLFSFSLILYFLVYFAFSIIKESYFDRYALPLILVLLLLLAPEIRNIGSSKFHLATCVLIITYTLSVLASKDFFSWQHSRWEAINYMKSKGVDAHRLDGGYEFNGWYQAGSFGIIKKEAPSWWWVDKDDFMIANGPLDGYSKIRSFPYQRYIPFTPDTLFILEKHALPDSLKLHL